jgi:hypothetical protein
MQKYLLILVSAFSLLMANIGKRAKRKLQMGVAKSFANR